MRIDVNDTIAALASAPGSAARGIIRISGPSTSRLLVDLLKAEPAGLTGSSARRMSVDIDLGLRSSLPVDVYFWPTTRSYTGQPAAELHTIGSPVLLEQLLFVLQRLGVRAARRGEFTLRAFLAGKIDLAQAEAVLGIIDAPDHEELESALEQLAGGLSGPVVELRRELIELLADLEAGLDFVDEDIEFISREDVILRLRAAATDLDELVAACDGRQRNQVRYRVVLAGLPNAGKSTLFNAVAGRHAAIVSSQSGTTRDYLSCEVEWCGLGVELVDTAGQEDASTSIIEEAAQAKMREACESAELVIWCSSADQSSESTTLDQESRAAVLRGVQDVLCIHTKADLRAGADFPTADIAISAQTGDGMDELALVVRGQLSGNAPIGRQLIGSTAARCRESLAGSADSIGVALRAAEAGEGDEFLALEIRECLDHLAMVLGETYTDDILDRVFSKFCIGK